MRCVCGFPHRKRRWKPTRAEAGLFDGGAGENLSNRQLGQLNDQLIDARSQDRLGSDPSTNSLNRSHQSDCDRRPRLLTCCNRPSFRTCVGNMRTRRASKPSARRAMVRNIPSSRPGGLRSPILSGRLPLKSTASSPAPRPNSKWRRRRQEFARGKS